jgi:hypothetical protein
MLAFAISHVIPTCRIQLLKDPISEYEATMNNTFSAEYWHVTLLSSNSVKTQKSILTLHYKDERDPPKKQRKARLIENLKGNFVGKLISWL